MCERESVVRKVDNSVSIVYSFLNFMASIYHLPHQVTLFVSTCCVCLSDVIGRGSVSLSPVSLRFNVPPPFCFPFSPSLCGLEYFISLVSLNEDESSVFTTHTSYPIAPSLCNKPSHKLLKTPGAFLFHWTHRRDTPRFISIPHSHTLTA